MKTQRGDLVLITEVHSYTFVHGSRPSQRSERYVFGIVSSVTRDGLVKAADRIGAATGERFARWWRRERDSFRHGIHVAAAAKLNADPVSIIRALGTDEFETIEAARDALMPFKS